MRSKREAVVTLRWLLIIAAAYLMLFSSQAAPGLGICAIVIVLLISNVVLARMPDEVVGRAGFDFVLLQENIG